MDGNVRIEIGPEEAAALWERFGKDKNALCLTTLNYEMEAFILAIVRERAKYEPLTDLNEDGLGPAITMRPSEARPLLQQFKYDVKNILSQIKTALRGDQVAKNIAIEIAVTEAVQRERERCAGIARRWRANEYADEQTPSEIADAIMRGEE